MTFELPLSRRAPLEKYIVEAEGVITGLIFSGSPGNGGFGNFTETLKIDVSFLRLGYSSTDQNFGNTPEDVNNRLLFNGKFTNNTFYISPHCGDQ